MDFKRRCEQGMLSVKRKQDEMSDDVDELLFLISSLIVTNEKKNEKEDGINDIQFIVNSVNHLFDSTEECESFVKNIYKIYKK
jgi:hypothetical protein